MDKLHEIFKLCGTVDFSNEEDLEKFKKVVEEYKNEVIGPEDESQEPVPEINEEETPKLSLWQKFKKTLRWSSAEDLETTEQPPVITPESPKEVQAQPVAKDGLIFMPSQFRTVYGRVILSLLDTVVDSSRNILVDPIYYGTADSEGKYSPKSAVGYSDYDPTAASKVFVTDERGMYGKMIISLTDVLGNKSSYLVDEYSLMRQTTLDYFLESVIPNVLSYIPDPNYKGDSSKTEVVLERISAYGDSIIYVEVRQVNQLDKFLQEAVCKKFRFTFTESNACDLQEFILNLIREKISFSKSDRNAISDMINKMMDDKD